MRGPRGNSVTVVVVFAILTSTAAPEAVTAISSKVSSAPLSIPLTTSSQSALSVSLKRLSTTLTEISSTTSSVPSLHTSSVTSSPPLPFCDFETAGLCGWTPVPSSGYSFRRHQGFTADRTSGPDSDHTFQGPQRGGGSGHYVFSSGWDAPGPGQTARLLSPPFTLTTPAHFSFWYHMNGKGVGSLTVNLLRPLRPGQRGGARLLTLWSVSGRQGRDWHCTHLSLQPGHWQVEFSSTVKHDYGSDIALDDISITPMDYVDAETTTDLPTTVTAESGTSTLKPRTRSSTTYTLQSTTLGNLNENVPSTVLPTEKLPASKQTPSSTDSTSPSTFLVPSSPKPTRVPSSPKPTRVPSSPKPTRVPSSPKPTRVPSSPKPTRVTSSSMTPGRSGALTSQAITSFSVVTATPLPVSTHTYTWPFSSTRITTASKSTRTGSNTTSKRTTAVSSKSATSTTVFSTSSVATTATHAFKPPTTREHLMPQTQLLSITPTTTTPPKNRTMAPATTLPGAVRASENNILVVVVSLGMLLLVLAVAAVYEYRQTKGRHGGPGPVGGLKEIALQALHQQEVEQPVQNGQITTLSTAVQIRF